MKVKMWVFLLNQRHLILNLNVLNLFQGRNFFKINLFSFSTFCRTCVSKLLNTLFLFGVCSLGWISRKFGFLASFSALSSALVSLGFTWYIRWAESFLWICTQLDMMITKTSSNSHILAFAKKGTYWTIVLNAEKIWEGLNILHCPSVSINNQHLWPTQDLFAPHRTFGLHSLFLPSHHKHDKSVFKV